MPPYGFKKKSKSANENHFFFFFKILGPIGKISEKLVLCAF